MRQVRWKFCLTLIGFFILKMQVIAQNFSFNCTRDTIIPGCPANLCFTLNAVIPDIHGQTSSYSLNPGSSQPSCFPVYLAPDDPAGTPTNLVIDDRYSSVITIGFPFPFYGTTYNTLVASTNGYISFDASLAGGTSHWQNRGDLPNTLYDRALVMGPYHDLDPSLTSSPTRKIQYQVWGTAPNRRWVLSFFKVPLFNCASLFQNTHQIILYESTGIIEVKIFDKQICSGWNNGKAMVGMQDFSRTQGMTAPARKMSDPAWGSVGMNETWRFVPDAGPSLLLRTELYDLGGNLISTGTTSPLQPGVLQASFPNVCPPAGALTTYIVRSAYQKIDDPAVEIYGTDTVRVSRLSPLTATITSTPATCGSANGILSVVSVNGGTPPYEYSLDNVNWQPANFFNGLAPGVYTVYIRDLPVVCQDNYTVTVAVTGTIPITTSTTPTACSGVNDGTIIISSAGGTGPYTFALDGGAPAPGTIPFTFNGISAGAHIVRVNDLGTGCNSGDVPVTVATGPGIGGNATSTAASCTGVNNGTVTATATSGLAPFNWSLDGGAFTTGANPYTFNGIPPGSHFVTIRDANNCTSAPIFVTVNTGTGVNGTGSTTGTSCPGVNDGTITVTATTGTAPFTWSLDGGAFAPGPNPFTYTGITSGPHTVTIQDANGCQRPVPVTVAAGPAPTAGLSSTSTACSGVNNGTVVVTSATGTAPYTFSLDGGAPQAGAIPYTFTNVAAGGHNVTVIDVNGCSTGPLPVTVSTGPGVNGNATSSATSCPAANNGSITVNATAGTAPFTYQLDGGAPQSGTNPYTFNNVGAGTHNVVITDNFGCQFTVNSITVNAGPVLTANTTPNATSCSGASNGSIIISPVGGAAPFTFILDGGAPQPGTPPFTFSNLAAGSHTVAVIDAAGCSTGNIPVTVAAGPALTTNVSHTDVLCNGGNTGTITIAVPSIGTPPYQYSLDNINWFSTNVFTGLTAGTYTAYYRESNGCQGQQNNIIVNEPSVLAVASGTTPVTCNGGSDGTITITPSGGIAPYEYSIDGGATWLTNNVFTVSANTYTFLVRDVNLCTRTVSATVTEPPVLTASSVNTNASCNGGNDGVITITASGGNTGGYQYSIDGTNFQPSNTFNVAPNTYTVTVKDNKGCTYNFPATVGLSNNLSFTPMVDPTICEGSSTNLNFTSNATVWSWAPATGLSNTAVANPAANPTTTTQYIVTATLDRCSTTDTVLVNVNPAPIPDAGPQGFICYGQTYQLQGSGGVSYSWTPSTYLDNPSLPNPTANAARTITYTLSILADINGCPSLVTDDVTVDVTPPIKVYTYPSDTIAYPGDKIQFKAVSVVPSANIFTWSPVLNINNPGISNPIVTGVNIGDSIVYKVTARSQAGCVGEAYVRFRVYKGPDLYVPNAFTPNGDGRNDRFYPFPVGIKEIKYFRVYNRWGQLMFSSNTLYKGWDGKFNGTDQPGGIFVWMGQAIDKNNKPITKQGTVTLIR